jgi:capsule polysaccharide modification protein KpsS
MKKLLSALTLLTLATPAMATPVAIDNGLMVDVPNIGYSRIETVTFCLNEGGVDKYQDLMTDSDFVDFEACLQEMT